jgi:hypothetical protein
MKPQGLRVNNDSTRSRAQPCGAPGFVPTSRSPSRGMPLIRQRVATVTSRRPRRSDPNLPTVRNSGHFGSVRVGGENFSASDGIETDPDRGVDRILDEPDRAVAECGVDAAWMATSAGGVCIKEGIGDIETR